jgi:hypothetical protein
MSYGNQESSWLGSSVEAKETDFFASFASQASECERAVRIMPPTQMSSLVSVSLMPFLQVVTAPKADRRERRWVCQQQSLEAGSSTVQQ